MNDLELNDFSGVARLFPLPDFVLFPHVLKPLHIFEPRYRQMTQDALDGDRLIALVLLKPGSEAEYEGQPEIHDLACLARIVNEQRLADGKFNILARGLCRLRIEKEVLNDRLYRSVQGWPMPDADQDDDPELRETLAVAVRSWLPTQGPAATQLNTLLQSDLKLGALCDILGFALPLSTEVKQALLEELDIAQRAARLTQELQTTTPPEQLHLPREKLKFPPDFSVN